MKSKKITMMKLDGTGVYTLYISIVDRSRHLLSRQDKVTEEEKLELELISSFYKSLRDIRKLYGGKQLIDHEMHVARLLEVLLQNKILD